MDAFVTINNGLETTKLTFDGKLGNQYQGFAASYNENPEKYGDAWTKAQKLRKEANDLIHHIDLIKAKCIAETAELPMDKVIAKDEMGSDTILDLRYLEGKDNYNVNTHLMIGAEPESPKMDDNVDGNNYRGGVLKNELMDYGKSLKAMVPENKTLVANIDSLFSYPEKIKDASGTVTNWESLNFYHVPLAATTTILSKLQTDVRNAESDILGYLFADVEAASFKFTELKAVVIPEKTYVLEGDSFRANVFLAAYDNTNLPEIKLAPEGMDLDSNATEIPGDKGMEVPMGADGFGRLALPARGLGDKQWEGIIKFKKPDGSGFVYKKYDVNYEVAKPSLVVSPIKMNVLYRGIPNPLAISVPGISQDALTPTISTGRLVKQSDGTYNAEVSSGSEAVVSVTADINGKRQSMGSFKFRLKYVPDPVANFAGKSPSDNTAKKSDLTAALGVIADLKDFVYDLTYPVTAFDITVIMGGDIKTLHSTSNRLTDDQKELLRQVRRNQMVIIENIRAKAPDGSVRKLGNYKSACNLNPLNMKRIFCISFFGMMASDGYCSYCSSPNSIGWCMD